MDFSTPGDSMTSTIGESESKEGRRKAIGVTAGRSGLWQQDIEQDAIPAISWTQSIAESGAAGAFEWRCSGIEQ
jgi:hypothetical protein